MKIWQSVLILAVLATPSWAQGTAFTYQGRLTDGNAAASGAYDFQFKLYGALSGGTALATVNVDDAVVTNGVFTVQLDFGVTHFANNAAQWLEICVRAGNQTGAYVTLTPRQPLNATPYALKSLLANDALQLNGVAASQYVQTNDARLTDDRNPKPGSANYIQNGTTPQAASHFNISGNGTAGGTLGGNVVNAATQFNLNGQRVLTAGGTNNLALGLGAGTGGFFSTMAGALAGQNNTGGSNSFFGYKAGAVNTTGMRNSFFGSEAGALNQTGGYNAFFGELAGFNNTTASENAFFGTQAGRSNTSGAKNTFVGSFAGLLNETGKNNAFFGASAGLNNTSDFNAFFGAEAGKATTTGLGNAFLGHVAGLSNETGSYNTFVGNEAGKSNIVGFSNTFLGAGAGFTNTHGKGNVAIGTDAGLNLTIENVNTLLGYRTKIATGVISAVALGAYAQVDCDNCLVLGSISGVNGASASTNVGIGTTMPTQRLHVAGDARIDGNLTVSGTLNALNTTVTNALQLGGVPASQYVQTSDARLSDARTPTAGSANYIQNGTTLQAAGNFNISGNGTAGGTLSGNLVNASTQFNLGGQRVLSIAGADNLFTGVGAGDNNTGTGNVFVGQRAGQVNQGGNYNSFFGFEAGLINQGGMKNAFFGAAAGHRNTASGNAFFGAEAGRDTTTGNVNAFVGRRAGYSNTLGDNNAFFGESAGYRNTTGSGNTYVGRAAGQQLTTENHNTMLGFVTNGAAGITNATALGARAQADCSNCLVLGSVSGVNGATANVNVGIGTPAPFARLHVSHDSLINNNHWGIHLQNASQNTFRGGLRLSNDGFFEITNNALGATVNFARLDGTGNWTAVSDRRMKTAIQPLRGLLTGALQLRPVSFQYLQQNERHIGFIAQEVAEVFPSLVTTGEVSTLNYAGLSVVAIGAVQEQQQQLDALQKQLAAAQAENAALRAGLTALQTRLTQLERRARRR